MIWAEKSLDELGYVSRGRSRHRPRDASHLYGGPYPFIQTSDIKHANLYITEYKQTYSEEGLAQSRMWPAGTLCITIAANIADTAILGIDACFPDSVIGFIPYDDKANARFIKYIFDALLQRRYKTFTQGAAQDNLSQSKLLSLKFPVPDIQQQRRIANILSVYDDLIINNQRRIGLLEQAARLLYKEWFVHFRFPGHEYTKITDGVPEGWKLSTIEEVCTDFIDGDWIETKDQGGEDYRILQISNIGENEFIETGNYRFITEETFHRLRCNEIKAGDILISRMPNPIGRAWFVTEQSWKMVTAVDVTIARPQVDKINKFYYLYHLNSSTHLAQCLVRATGATRPRISRKNMGSLPIIIPSCHLQDKFAKFVQSLHEAKVNLRRQIELSTRARDILLPRLMNGEISV